jgi:hypothetical protein
MTVGEAMTVSDYVAYVSKDGKCGPFKVDPMLFGLMNKLLGPHGFGVVTHTGPEAFDTGVLECFIVSKEQAHAEYSGKMSLAKIIAKLFGL